MSSSMGGSQTTSAEIPAYLDAAAQDVVNQAAQAASVGYMANPNAGVAAFTPMQVSAMTANNTGMNAYGLGGVEDPMAGMPQAVNLGGGVMGYRSYPIYRNSQQDWRRQNPGQGQAYDQMFVDPKAKGGQGAKPGQPAQPATGAGAAPKGQPVYQNGKWVYPTTGGAK